MLKYFAESAGLHITVIQINQVLEDWWKVDCTHKQKPMFRAVPAFIIWVIWKRRNVIKHGGKMSKQDMINEVIRNPILFTNYRYPWLQEIPNSRPLLVKYLEYIPLICHKVVKWNHPPFGSYKCNTDGLCKGNPGPGSMAFCVRNDAGELVYAETRYLKKCTVLESEMKAIRMGVEHCAKHNLFPLIETDSLRAEKVINGVWETPWSVSLDVGNIKDLIRNRQVKVEHTVREGNQLADFFTNYNFLFVGTTVHKFNNFQEVPIQAKAIIQLEKSGIPNIRIKKMQNKEFRS